MANRMMIVLASPEEILVKEGDGLDINDAMYFIASGSCIVEQKDIINYNAKPVSVGNLQTGDYFGVSISYPDIFFRKSLLCITA
jgi:hypothetical protein